MRLKASVAASARRVLGAHGGLTPRRVANSCKDFAVLLKDAAGSPVFPGRCKWKPKPMTVNSANSRGERQFVMAAINRKTCGQCRRRHRRPPRGSGAAIAEHPWPPRGRPSSSTIPAARPGPMPLSSGSPTRRWPGRGRAGRSLETRGHQASVRRDEKGVRQGRRPGQQCGRL